VSAARGTSGASHSVEAGELNALFANLFFKFDRYEESYTQKLWMGLRTKAAYLPG
jgi:hypothetical protein